MVLVTKEWQKRGFATRLLQTCIERLEENGLVPVLDATPAGENVYRPLGFIPHFSFQRWEHDAVETINTAGAGGEHFDAAQACAASKCSPPAPAVFIVSTASCSQR